ncbi:DUF2889 domain-containing protein [Pelotomaculum propionicicum]|uniref:DUF2889 domain-containing protein n=1 Tax=Pelotomaculum propionicicum TaxID=258475 RepID=A0A4Y7RNN9_9FIRM|nr:DUF2889 domain-containing protein [Pelotomaculum propionicicum]NLI12866.1 DUF2889 domain-containing protein [Peptococcaceae bacterium]TEB10292.1 hypothetical protein Pmgp_02489 [Pelotomaculum propionicicum]
MKYIFQRNWFSSVKSLGKQQLLAETNLIGTEIEAVGRLVIDKSTFVIKEAGWEVSRSPGGLLNGGRDVPELIGATAYFNAGGDLRRAVGGEAGGLARELLAECTRGIIQAETFLYVERGFGTPENYGAYWEREFLNSCRYYSNLDRISRRWPEYVGGYCPGTSLYKRAKNCSVFKAAGKTVTSGVFSDSFHEMNVWLEISREGTVAECGGSFLRAPDQVCFENAGLLGRLRGLTVSGLSKKQIAGVIGGSGGCDHLVDLVNDLFRVLENLPGTIGLKMGS